MDMSLKDPVPLSTPKVCPCCGKIHTSTTPEAVLTDPEAWGKSYIFFNCSCESTLVTLP